MKKISLISLMSAMFVAPAMATSHTSDTFPANELMQEDYTYQNQATYTNMGVYSGSVTANAEYEWTPITVTAGNYLPRSSTSTSQCEAGYFCPGLADPVHYDEDNAQGLMTCNSYEIGGGLFSHSAAGSTANTDCYRDCDVENMGSNGSIATIPHATALTGNDYYNDTANDTCVASACESGWSLGTGANAGTCVANTITITWNGASSADIAANEAGSCTYGGDIRTPRAATPVTGKTFVGWRFEKPVFDLSTLTNAYPYGGGYLNYYGEGYSENFDLTNNMWGLEFQDEYDEEHDTTPSWKVRGEARCSDTNDGQYDLYDTYYGNSGNGVSISANPGNATTGKYCWFRTTGYQPIGASTWQEVTSNPWIFMYEYQDAENCRQNCAMYVDMFSEHAMEVNFLFGKPNNND